MSRRAGVQVGSALFHAERLERGAQRLCVEYEFAARICDGQVPGNGGGAPVVVSGWTCQGYDTPDVLRTGNASQCHNGGNAILAVLPVPGATQSAS